MKQRVAWPLVLSIVIPWIVVSAACNASVSPVATAAATATTAHVATLPAPLPTPTVPSATPTRVPPTRVPATATPTATRTAPPPSATPTLTPAPGASHEEVFEAAWQAVHDYYVYPDFNGLDWDAVHEDYGAQVRAATSDEAFYVLMKEMIDALKDDHSRFLTPDEVRHDDQRQSGSGDYVGVGFASVPVIEKRLATILLVWPDSPADAAGLRAHDNILAIDGQPAVVPGGVYTTGLTGEEGTAVTVTIRTPGSLPHDFVLVRERLPLPLPVTVRQLPGDIAYLMVPWFYDDTVVDRLIEALNVVAKDGPPFRGMILDLRLNSGGSLKPARQLWSLFTNGSVLHLIHHGDRYKVTVEAQDVQGSQTLPLVVLAGPYSESLGEVTAGILQDLGRARVVGMQTKGNVELIDPIDFPDGSRLWLADGMFLPRRHGDVVWNGVGVTPDVLVDAPWETFPEDADPQLQAALDLLR
jgi:carboxyl-terminal processing protease